MMRDALTATALAARCESGTSDPGAERDLQVASTHRWMRALKYFCAHWFAHAEAA